MLSGEALSSGHQCASTHLELSCAPPLQERSLSRRSEPSDRLAEVIRVDRLRSREHVSGIAVAAAVHLGRVRFPCASSATLGNSTKRVNGRLALERRSGYRPWSRFSCRIVAACFLALSFFGGAVVVGTAADGDCQLRDKRYK